MEWNIYKDWLDPVLYRQMVSMIYQLSSNADKEAFLKQERENSLFYGICEHSMEEEYNLHYPGEVLERMKERRTMTKPVYRALGLALAGTSCIQETCMFNGTQKSGFWKQFGKVLGEKDLCYLAVRCLLATKDRKLWVDALHQYPYEKVEEMIFILSVFPESDTLWQKLKGKIAACFGRERRLSVYEDWHFYAWIAMKYEKRLKNDRTKETAVLKQVVKLSQTNAANANGALEEQLIKNGYKKEEVIFLNGILTGARRYLDPNSLTAEKIAVRVLKTFLPGEKMYPDVVYELCETFLRKYDCFPVRLGGQEKIQNCLYGMKVENVRTFLTLFPFRKNGMKEWHYINLNQEKWHCLAAQLKEEEFEKCVNDTLRNGTFEKPELESYLAAYQKLTGREYVEIFWKKIDYDLRHVFHLLSENEILDAVGLMKQFLKEYREMRNKEPDQDAFEPIPFIGEADTGENQTGEAEKVFGEKWDSMLYYLKADILVTWALENAIETSDSMRSRGYGLKGRTAFSIYHFTRKDKYVLGMMIGLSAIFTGGCIKGAAYASYDPRILLAGFTIQGYAAPVSVSPLLALLTYLCFAAFCFLPVLLDVTETIRFSYSRRKETADLEMTYQKIYQTLEQEGTDR